MLLHNLIRYCVVFLAVCIIVFQFVSYVITVRNHKTVLLGCIRCKHLEVFHINIVDVWTKPARCLSTKFFNDIKLTGDFIVTRELFLAANSCIAFFLEFFLTITEISIPVLCDVETTESLRLDHYRWHCFINWHVESRIVIINVANILRLLYRFIGPHWIKRIEGQQDYYQVSNQRTTTSDCSPVNAISSVVDWMRRLDAYVIKFSD